MKTLIERIFYHLYLLFNFIVLRFFYLRIPFFKNKKIKQSILALPYTPRDWPGGYDRMDAWADLFRKEGYTYEVEYAWNKNDSLLFDKSNHLTRTKYKIYFKILFARLKLLGAIGQYEHVWVQRAFIPMFPYKDAYFDKLLSKIHPHVIYDFYDADYEANYNLVMSTVLLANKVTVATEYLRAKFITHNTNTFLLRYAIDTSSFVAKNTNGENQLKIGWMGSPGNAKNLLAIASQLEKITSEFPNIIFSFVCRDMPSLKIQNMELLCWGNDNFNYFEWLSSIDIGIVPFINPDERTKAKISMKGLEFMASGTAMCCSEFIHSDKLINGRSYTLVKENEWYEALKNLITNQALRLSIGKEAKKVFDAYHSYPKIYADFLAILKK